MKRALSVLVALLFLTAVPAHAWVGHGTKIAAIKAATPPPLDPALTDPIWQTALKLDNFYDYTGRSPAKLATTAYVLYDAKYIYVGVKVQQAGIPITATQTVDHAGVATDDHISINFDTVGNGSRVYQFRANPKGIHDEASSENARYAPDWISLAKIFPNGDYNLLFVIPFSVIRGEAGASQSWRFDVVRFIAASNDEYTWAYDPTMNNVGSSQFWPFLTGIQIAAAATRPQAHADVYGLVSAGSDHRQFQNGIGNFQNIDPRNYGLDLTVPLTNTLAFVGTANPDFSNVEQDQTTIAPQEFERQYSEYRPFFAQGANFLGTIPGININSYQTLLYTPAIGIFNHGEKIEGTVGQNAIGLLNVGGNGFSDRALGYSFTKVDNSFTLGFEDVATDDRNVGVHDNAYGLGIATTNPHSGAIGLASLQSDRGSDVTDASQADDLSLGGGVQNAHWLAFATWKDIGPQFAPYLGYTQINDIRGPQGIVQYSGSGDKGTFLKSYQVTFVADRYLNRAGFTHEADVDANANLTFSDNVSFGYGAAASELRFGDLVLPFDAQTLSLGYKDGSPSPADAMYSWGPFEGYYLQQFMSSTSRQFGLYGFSFEYDGTVERATALSAPGTPDLDTQWLRRVSLTRSFGKNASLAIGLRAINGDGGFGLPGTNIAISYHKRFANLDEVYFDYGTPAADQTLHRWILKYIFHFGGATGT